MSCNDAKGQNTQRPNLDMYNVKKWNLPNVNTFGIRRSHVLNKEMFLNSKVVPVHNDVKVGKNRSAH